MKCYAKRHALASDAMNAAQLVTKQLLEEQSDRIAARCYNEVWCAMLQANLSFRTIARVQKALAEAVLPKLDGIYTPDMANAVFDRKSLLRHNVDLVADNGDRAYGTVQDFVFILTCDEYRKYRDYIPHYDRWIWTATPWYCGDKDSDTGKTRYVRGVSQDGRLDYYYAYYDGVVAPACILNPKSLNLRQSMAFVEEVAE